MALTLAQFAPHAYELGLTKVFGDELTRHGKEYTSWLRTTNAERLTDTYWATSGTGLPAAKGVGEPYVVDQIFDGPRKTFGLSIWGNALVIQDEAIYWDQYGIFKGLAKDMARNHIERENLVAFALVNHALDAAPTDDYKDYNGQPICATSKTRMDGGTWKNRHSSNAGLSYKAIQDALVDLGRTVNERGIFAKVAAKTLLIAVEQDFIAREIFGSTNVPHEMSNTTNTLKGSGISPMSYPYITSTTAWLLTNKELPEIWMRFGMPPTMRSGVDPKTDNRYVTTKRSMATCVYRTYGWYGSSGDGA